MEIELLLNSFGKILHWHVKILQRFVQMEIIHYMAESKIVRK